MLFYCNFKVYYYVGSYNQYYGFSFNTGKIGRYNLQDNTIPLLLQSSTNYMLKVVNGWLTNHTPYPYK